MEGSNSVYIKWSIWNYVHKWKEITFPLRLCSSHRHVWFLYSLGLSTNIWTVTQHLFYYYYYYYYYCSYSIYFDSVCHKSTKDLKLSDAIEEQELQTFQTWSTSIFRGSTVFGKTNIIVNITVVFTEKTLWYPMTVLSLEPMDTNLCIHREGQQAGWPLSNCNDTFKD